MRCIAYPLRVLSTTLRHPIHSLVVNAREYVLDHRKIGACCCHHFCQTARSYHWYCSSAQHKRVRRQVAVFVNNYKRARLRLDIQYRMMVEAKLQHNNLTTPSRGSVTVQVFPTLRSVDTFVFIYFCSEISVKK